MELAIDELHRTRKYHQRQLEENVQKIKHKEESIELLKLANEKHIEILEQLSKAVKTLEKSIATTMLIEKDSNDSIQGVS